MRDPNRLDAFYDELKELHKRYCPDLRFGQLMVDITSASGDPYYWEESKFMDEFKKFLRVNCNDYEEDKKVIYKDTDITPAIIYIPKNCVGLTVKAEIYEKGETVTAEQDMNTEQVYEARVKGDNWEDDNTYYFLTEEGMKSLSE